MQTEIKKAIVSNFFHSVLWIDDEIRFDGDDSKSREKYNNLFLPLSREFSQAGILCQLKDFPPIKPDDNIIDRDEICICKKLAAKADVVILDWALGCDDSTHSKDIIDHLLSNECGGIRFIVILSKASNLEEQFKASYGDSFKKYSGDSWYDNKKGQYITLLQKDLFYVSGSASGLMEAIYGKLSNVFPDHLHWAAMEIAGKFKHFIPSWLSSIPRETTLGILLDATHSDDGNTGYIIFENLFEDFIDKIEYSSVTAIQKENLKIEGWEGISAVERFVESLESDKKAAIIDALKNIYALKTPSNASKKKIIEDLEKIKKEIPSEEIITSLQREMGQFECFCETKSGVSNKLGVRTGSIIKIHPEGDSAQNNEIWICVSQSCDCAHKKKLLFMRGIAAGEADDFPGSTLLSFNGDIYVFRGLAENIKCLEVDSSSRVPSGYTLIGCVRDKILSRIMNRYWSYATRVGVNQPFFVRKRRGER